MPLRESLRRKDNLNRFLMHIKVPYSGGKKPQKTFVSKEEKWAPTFKEGRDRLNLWFSANAVKPVLRVLPRWLRGKNPLTNAADMSWIPGSGGSPGEGDSNPFQYSCLILANHPNIQPIPKFHGQRSLVGCSPWGCKELDMTEHAHTTVIRTAFIYKAANSLALKGKEKHQLPVFWSYNKKAWTVRTLFLNWFHWCFVPEVRKYLASKWLPFKFLLILNNNPGHPEPHEFNIKGIKAVYLLSPNSF